MYSSNRHAGIYIYILVDLQKARFMPKRRFLLYYHKESITECPRSNIFMVTPENKLITPATQMLKGITRQNILKVAAAHQIEVEIRPIELAEIKTAKEVFISSSTKRILPVSRLDDHFFPEISSNLISARLFSYLLELEQ